MLILNIYIHKGGYICFLCSKTDNFSFGQNQEVVIRFRSYKRRANDYLDNCGGFVRSILKYHLIQVYVVMPFYEGHRVYNSVLTVYCKADFCSGIDELRNFGFDCLASFVAVYLEKHIDNLTYHFRFPVNYRYLYLVSRFLALLLLPVVATAHRHCGEFRELLPETCGPFVLALCIHVRFDLLECIVDRETNVDRCIVNKLNDFLAY